ncbi:MAG: sigma-70 family RNA polymerase sigma factor [Candidatus Omnitrophica bacterium]|nr:sigma-70 family RNA polymerase sigma factor [Candidatus Omnitrophota bacterium]
MEEELILRAKSGDREAFDELYQRYKRPILNYIYRFIGNRADAEELTQEVFVRAYVNIQRFEPRAKLSSWLYRIAGNLAKNHIRHAQYDKRVASVKKSTYEGSDDEFDVIEAIEDRAKKPDEKLASKETERIVQETIDQLPAHLKEALILCDIEGLSYEEAAKIMRCRPMTVGSRLWRAREKLAKMLHYIKNGETKR